MLDEASPAALREMLYLALASPHGLVVRSSAPARAMARLRQAKLASMDQGLDGLGIYQAECLGANFLVIARKPEPGQQP